MFELIYMSSAASGTTIEGARGVAEQSQMNNALSDISGILLFDGTHFLQVIEGHERAVRRLFETISSDNRHSDVKVLTAGTTSGRSFAGWSMAFTDTRSLTRLLQRIAETRISGSPSTEVEVQLVIDCLKCHVLESLQQENISL